MKIIKYIFTIIIFVLLFGFLNVYVFNEWQRFANIQKEDLIGEYEFKAGDIVYQLTLQNKNNYNLVKKDKNNKVLKTKQGKWFLEQNNIVIKFDQGHYNLKMVQLNDIYLGTAGIKLNIFKNTIKIEAFIDDVGGRDYIKGAEGNEFFIKNPSYL